MINSNGYYLYRYSETVLQTGCIQREHKKKHVTTNNVPSKSENKQCIMQDN